MKSKREAHSRKQLTKRAPVWAVPDGRMDGFKDEKALQSLLVGCHGSEYVMATWSHDSAQGGVFGMVAK